MVLAAERANSQRALPPGWRWPKLGDICEVTWGNTSITKASYVPVGYAAYSASGFDGYLKHWEYNQAAIVLSAIGARCGKCFLAKGKWTAIKNTIVIWPKRENEADVQYLFFYLNREDLWPTDAMAQPFITMAGAQSVDVPLPPLQEQRRIAGILNDKMAGVERARAAAEARLEAAKALPAAYLRAVFSSPEAQQWPVKSLGEICRDISDGTHFTPTYVSSGIPFLSVKDVKETGLSFSDCRYISEEQHCELSRRCKPERGDVLYTKVGTTGIAKAIETDREFSIFVSVALLKLTDAVLPEFLEKALNSSFGRTQAANLTQGMANRNLVIQDLKRIRIPTPPVPDQVRIAAILNEQIYSAERTRKAIEEELDTINKLPAALLRRAFAGEL